MRYFLLKNCKKSPIAEGFASRHFLPSAAGESASRPSIPHGYATASHHSFNAEYQAGKVWIPTF